MSGIDEGDGAEELEPPVDPGSEPPPPDPAIEAEARKYGWRPKETFTKTPESWRDAASFLEAPQTQVKILRDELKDRDKRFAAVEQMAKSAADRVRDQERATFQAQLAALETQKREAAESADLARYDAIQTQQRALRPPVEAPADPGVHPDVKAKVDAAEWTKDPEMFGFAQRLIGSSQEYLDLPPSKQFEVAERKVKEYWPERFKEPERPKVPGAGKVDGGSLAVPGRINLSADELREAEGFVKQGIFKSVKEYAEYSAKLYGGA